MKSLYSIILLSLITLNVFGDSITTASTLGSITTFRTYDNVYRAPTAAENRINAINQRIDTQRRMARQHAQYMAQARIAAEQRRNQDWAIQAQPENRLKFYSKQETQLLNALTYYQKANNTNEVRNTEEKLNTVKSKMAGLVNQ